MEDPGFIVAFLLSSCMGLVLTYSQINCTQVNDATITSVCGFFKDSFMIVLGLFLFGDVTCVLLLALALSLAASKWHTLDTLRRRALRAHSRALASHIPRLPGVGLFCSPSISCFLQVQQPTRLRTVHCYYRGRVVHVQLRSGAEAPRRDCLRKRARGAGSRRGARRRARIERACATLPQRDTPLPVI
jgi:hypothetical protein